MLEIRDKLKKYSELIYSIAVVTLCAIRSVGLGSKEAAILTALALLAAGIKILLTDYEKKEVLLGLVFIVLLTYTLVHNGDKMLLMTLIVVWGAKNVRLKKILAICLVTRVPLMFIRILLALTGVIPGSAEELVKTNPYTSTVDKVMIRDYGFFHVNYLFLALFSVGLLLLVVFEELEKKNKPAFIAIISAYTVLLYGAYKVLLCRTGFYMWLCIYGIVLLWELISRIEILRKIYVALLVGTPFILLTVSLVLAILRQSNELYAYHYDALFSGRFYYFSLYVNDIWKKPLGLTPHLKLDNGYFYGLYNYGYIALILLLILLVKAMYRLVHSYHPILMMALVGTAGYMMGEATPWSIAWNPTIILLAYGVFQSLSDTSMEGNVNG